MIDATQFRKALGAYPTGVCVITARDDNGDNHAMVVGSFTSISLDPPLVGFFPAISSRTWQLMQNSPRFCINVLGAGQEDYCQRFTARDQDKFEGLVPLATPAGLPRLVEALAWIDVDVESVTELGDHVLVVGRVTALDAEPEGEPMIFFRGRYRQLAEMPEA